MESDKVIVHRVVGDVESNVWGYDVYTRRNDGSYGEFIAWFGAEKCYDKGKVLYYHLFTWDPESEDDPIGEENDIQTADKKIRALAIVEAEKYVKEKSLPLEYLTSGK